MSLSVNEFWKSVNIRWSYRQECRGLFFDSYSVLTVIFTLNHDCVRKSVTLIAYLLQTNQDYRYTKQQAL